MQTKITLIFILLLTTAALCIAHGPLGFASLKARGQDGTTGGDGGPTVTVDNLNDLKSYATQSGAVIIQISGTITGSDEISIASDKTFLGLGADATLDGIGLYMEEGTHNVIIQNLNFTNAIDDAIRVYKQSHHVWIDHCDITSAMDGLIDVTQGSDCVTISWCYLHDHYKDLLFKYTHDKGNDLRITMHHCYLKNLEWRSPQIHEGGTLHMFNCYYDGHERYAVDAYTGAQALIENCYLKDVNTPYREVDGGAAVQEKGNVYENCGSVSASGNSLSPPYEYTVEDAANVPELLIGQVGPQEGSVGMGNAESTMRNGEIGIRVWPVPFSSQVTFEMRSANCEPRDWSYKIFSVTGKLIFSAVRFSHSAFRTWDGRDNLGNSLPPSQYIVRALQGDRTYSSRVVLQ